jgi:predicted amidophosphoribosyltransferase
MISETLVALERLLLPNSCVACGRMVGQTHPDRLVCSICRTRLRPVPAGCERCRQPLPPVGPCRFCADWPELLRTASSAVWLGNEARQMVHHLKYGGLPWLAQTVAETIDRLVSHPGRGFLVPIPLGGRRLRQRGYNQAAEIARALGALWSLPVAEGVLWRHRETRTQTKLTPEERAENVRGAFEAAAPPHVRRDGGGEGEEGVRRGRLPSVILIDDVLTTGATLAAAAAALVDAGWCEVGAVTFARAMPLVVQLEVA